MAEINIQIRSERCQEIATDAVKRFAAVVQYELNIAAKNKQKPADTNAVIAEISRRLEIFVVDVCNRHIDITNNKDFDDALKRSFGYDTTKL